MSLSAPMRLDSQLVELAKQKGRLYKRNARNQLEFWAELGRSVEKHINPEMIVAINEGLLQLDIKPVKTSPISSDKVFSQLDNKNRPANFLMNVAESQPVYQVSQQQPGALERLMPDGSKQIGRFVEGEFHPFDL